MSTNAKRRDMADQQKTAPGIRHIRVMVQDEHFSISSEELSIGSKSNRLRSEGENCIYDKISLHID